MATSLALALLVGVAALLMTDLVDGGPPSTAVGPMNGERLYSFSAIATKLPGHRDNAHANSCTVWRWAMKGVRVNGQLIKLEAIRLGCSWKTSLEAVARFTEKLTAASLPSDDTPPALPAPTLRQRTRAARTASAKADRIFGSAKAGK